jgi:putative ABC transport system permease protein
LEISEKVSKELRAFGANIIIEPKVEGLADISGQKRYLREADIVKAKTIFWRHNILGIAPFLKTDAKLKFKGYSEQVDVIGTWYEKELPLPGETRNFLAGSKTVSPWWNLEGQWPASDKGIVIGTSLSSRLGVKRGDSITLDGRDFTVTGILETGGKEDNQVFMELRSLQEFKDMKGRVSHVLVSALSKPMDEFAYKDPEEMTQAEYEKWYCTGYITSIARQLEEVFKGSSARPIWQVAETEGKILKRLRSLIYLLSFIALVASALGVSTTMVMSLLRRIQEIGLMKAIGADSRNIIVIFLSEGVVVGLIGGLCGYVLSIIAARYIGMEVFNTGFEHRSMLLPIAIGSAILISIGGTLLPIKRALRIRPGVVLRGAE